MKAWIRHRRDVGSHVFVSSLAALACLSSTAGAQDAALSSAIQRALEEEHYDAVWQVGTPFADVEAAWQAPNRAENLRTFFLDEGVRIVPRQGGVGEWSLSLGLKSLRRGDSVRAVRPGELTKTAERMEVRRPGIVEWYTNDARGLEQGFDLAERFGSGSGELELLIDIEGELELDRVEHDSVELSEGQAEGRVSMQGLFAFDATGRDLPVRFECRGEDLAIVVDDSQAQYPITIDPIIQNESTPLEVDSPPPGAQFGRAVDIDGSRALVGAPAHNVAYLFELQPGGNWELDQKFAAFSPQPGDHFGGAVALNGSRVIISAPNEDSGSLVSVGKVYSYIDNGTFYSFDDQFNAPETQFEMRFGASLAAEGEWLVVGCPRYDGNDNLSGAIFIYRRGGNWDLHQSLTPTSSTGANNFMGTSVAIAGSSIAVGAPGANNGEGNVRMYSLSTFGTSQVWFHSQTLSLFGVDSLGRSVDTDGVRLIAGAPSHSNDRGLAQIWVRDGNDWEFDDQFLGTSSGDRFGTSVAIESNLVGGPRALVGSPQNNIGSGAVTALLLTSDQGWIVQEEIAGNVASSSKFGHALALHGDKAVVGAYDAVEGLGRSGMVQDYILLGGQWLAGSGLVGSDAGDRDYAGTSVAIDGDVAAVGVPNDDDQAFDAGGVYVFEREGSDWNLTGKLTAGNNSSPFAKLGTSVAVSGNRVLAGAPGGKHSSGTQSGVAWLFGKTLTGGWTAGTRIQPLDPVHAAEFGYAVDIDGSAMVIGAPLASTPNGNEHGAAYVFRIGFSIAQEDKLTAQDSQFAERLGHAVAIHGDRLVVGAPGYSLQDPQEGRLRVYVLDNTNWVDDGMLLDIDLQGGARFGSSVAIDGSLIVGGAPGGDQGDGRVVIFERVPDAWNLHSLFFAVDPAGEFGSAVDFDGETLAVGAPLVDGDEIDSGAAYLYLFANSDWTRVDLNIAGAVGGCQLGAGVAVSGANAVVGAPRLSLDVFEDGQGFIVPVPSGENFVPYALGDGSEGPCPCGNESAPSEQAGCANSTGFGARLTASGSNSISADDLAFSATGLPAGQPALLYMGTQQGSALPFGDGLNATIGFQVRLQTRPADSAGVVSFDGFDMGLDAQDAGSQRYFQVWYRDPVNGGACGNFFNFSSGIAVAFEQ